MALTTIALNGMVEARRSIARVMLASTCEQNVLKSVRLKTWLFTQAWPIAVGDMASLSVVASGAGALAGAIIAADIAGLVMPKTRQAATGQ